MPNKKPRKYVRIPYLLMLFYACTIFSISFNAPVWSVNVAKVSEQSITKEEFDRELQLVKSDNQDIDLTLAKQTALNNLIDRKILMIEIESQKIIPKPQVVEEYYQKEIAVYGGDEKFKQQLKKLNMTENQYKDGIIKEMKIQEILYRNVYSKLKPVSLTEAQEYYNTHAIEFMTPDRVRIRHIFILTKPDASNEEKLKKLQKANDALKKLKEGIDFAAVAKEYSESDLAAVGGDIGRFIRKGELDAFPEVEEVAFSLDSGQFSDIIHSKIGYHLIKLEQRETGQLKPFELVKNQIVDKIQGIKTKTIYNQWFTQVKSKYTIEIFNENL